MNDISNFSPITYENLRQKGFKLHIPFGNTSPHMRIEVDRRQDTHLELGPGIFKDSKDWCVWIVSEISQRYGRLCFLRSAWTMGQVNELYSALTDHTLTDIEWNAEDFHDALKSTTEICEKHFKEIYTNQRISEIVLMPR